MSQLTLIIPVYDEGENIIQTLNEVNKYLQFDGLKISIVYDFDEDNTLPAVHKYLEHSKKDNINLVKNKYERGVLNAIKTGLESVESGSALVTMADLSDDLSKVPQMLGMIDNGYDLVCGSRYIKGGKQIGGPWFKSMLSHLAGVSLHLLTRIPTHDVTNSFKLYSVKVLKAIEIESNGGFELGMEITIKSYLKGFKIGEVPTCWTDRVFGESNFKLWKWLPKYIYWYVYAVINVWLRLFKFNR